MDQSFYISELISKEIKGNISDQEIKELNHWKSQSAANLSVYENAINTKNQLKNLKNYGKYNSQKAWSNIENELFTPKTIHLFSRKFMKYAAAFLIPIMLAGGAGYFYFNNQSKLDFAQLDNTIKPATKKATLVLSDGGTHVLDNSQTANIYENKVEISNQNNVLSYSPTEAVSEFTAAIYNKLITPLGGGYNLKLADGTSVWLNAGSTLNFPVAFTDSTRQVFLEGEAYFEVAHNGQPFIVSSGGMDIRVMGTSFNVSAYADDLQMKTTLVEGKVRVDYKTNNARSESKFLTPNKQAVIQMNNPEISVSEVDASQYTSWIGGKLEFNNETLDNVMVRLARWYDFEFEFENAKAKNFHFSGRLNSQEKISTILEMLELTTDVKFSVIENKIVIE